MKQTLFLKLTLSVASIASMLGASTMIAQPAYAADALNCAILPQNICDAAKTGGTDTKKTAVFILLIWVLNILTAGVGIAAVGALIYAGILYASAGGGSEQIVKSKKIITDTVIGIITYALMFLVINWLVPGGVIG
ncbi:hypothetical protein H7Y29_02020 [Microbacteriaceae bacterium]|nr:hypothetical protein [Candidatus Saccharibacteria bacterium]